MTPAKPKAPFRGRNRADRRRLRALLDAGEQVEAHGLLYEKDRLAECLSQGGRRNPPAMKPGSSTSGTGAIETGSAPQSPSACGAADRDYAKRASQR